MAVRLCDIAVIDMDHGLVRQPLFHLPEIRGGCRSWNAFFKMSGQAVGDIDFSGRLMQLVNDVCQQAASGSQHAISDVGGKFLFWLWEPL